MRCAQKRTRVPFISKHSSIWPTCLEPANTDGNSYSWGLGIHCPVALAHSSHFHSAFHECWEKRLWPSVFPRLASRDLAIRMCGVGDSSPQPSYFLPDSLPLSILSSTLFRWAKCPSSTLNLFLYLWGRDWRGFACFNKQQRAASQEPNLRTHPTCPSFWPPWFTHCPFPGYSQLIPFSVAWKSIKDLSYESLSLYVCPLYCNLHQL